MGMGFWRWPEPTDVGCGHRDMGRIDKGSRTENFRASRDRGSSSQDLCEDLSSRQESFRMKMGTILYYVGMLSLSKGSCKSA